MGEVGALEEERFGGRLGEGVGEAIAEVQGGGVAATFAKIAVGFASDACLGFGDRLNEEFGGADEVVEAAAGDRVAATVNYGGGFDVVDGGDAPGLGGGDGLGKRVRFGLIAEDGDEGGRVDDHRGKPLSS